MSRSARGGRNDRPSRVARHVRPASEMRALRLAAFGSCGGELRSQRGKYEVVLADRRGEAQAAFRTSVFSGPARVDLEDAWELGRYEQVLVRRRRGRFTGLEAAQCLTEIIDDLTWESGHELQFFRLDAAPGLLRVCRLCNLHEVVSSEGREFPDALVELLELSGFAPRVERLMRRWLVLSLGPTEARGHLAVALGARAASAVPAALRLPAGATTILLRPQDRAPALGEGGIRYQTLAALLRALHLARIETLKIELRAVPARKRRRAQRRR